MICNYSSVLFLCVTFIFCCSIGLSDKLTFFLLVDNNIIKCSDYEYLIITDWSKFISSNISCPNQDKLFQKPISIYNYTRSTYICDTKTKTFLIKFYASILSQEEHEKKHLSKTDLSRLSSTINIDDRSYLFKLTKLEDSYEALVVNVSLSWSFNNTYVLYATFTEQPTICRIELYLTETVENEKCTDESGRRFMLCYYDPLSKLIVQNVDWTQIKKFVNDTTYTPTNWTEKGGYYLDIRLLKTTTTSTTTTTSATTSTTSSTTTTGTTTSTITTTTTGTTTSTVTTTTTRTTTSTTTTATTTTTTTTTSTTTTTTTATTTTILTSSPTSVVDSTEIMTTSSAIASTALDYILTTDIEIVTTVLSNVDTKFDKIVNITSTRQITTRRSTKTSRKLKPPKNDSVLLKRPSTKKNSSSLSVLSVLLLIFFIFCIIASVLFFIFRFRRNRQDDNQSLMDRVDSEESHKSDMDESETESSNDAKSDRSEIGNTRKGGRVLNQLDPDAL